MRLEHVNMTVKDLEESRHFDCELLGGEVAWRERVSDWVAEASA